MSGCILPSKPTVPTAMITSFILLYTNDMLVITKRAEQILRDELGHFFESKDESIGPPNYTSGTHMKGKVGQWHVSLVFLIIAVCTICSSKCGGVHSKKSSKELEDAIQSQTLLKSTYQPAGCNTGVGSL